MLPHGEGAQGPWQHHLRSRGRAYIKQQAPPALPGAAGTASLCKAFGPDGKRRRYQVSGRTKQDVIEAPKKKSAEIDAGPSTPWPCRAEAAAHDWLEHRRRCERTRKVRKDARTPLLAKFGKRRCGTSPPGEG